jgi:uracil-DNA glycosylase family 4
VSLTDGLELTGAYITAAVRCAPPQNTPTPVEQQTCSGSLERELALLKDVKVLLALGDFAYRASCNLLGIRPRPKFAHGAEATAPDGRLVICSYHPSQQNTFTGKLTEAMLERVLRDIRKFLSRK